MCRYAGKRYKNHFACFRCRKGFKRQPVSEWPKHLQPADGIDPAPCPECGQPMADMGLDFKSPPQNDEEHWEVVEFLFERGFSYHSCGCGGPGYRPSRWREVESFLEGHHCLSDGQRLLAKIKARAHSR